MATNLKRMLTNMINENKILYKELSYKLQGIFFAIRNDLGSGHKESIYQKALEKELINSGIKFKREPAIKIFSVNGEFLGLYRPDFLVENTIVIELKATAFVTRQESARIYDYLRNSEYELAYLVNFASPKLYIRRFIFTNDRKNSQIATNNNPRKTTNYKTNSNEAIRRHLSAIRAHSWIIFFIAISSLFVGIHGVQAAELNLISQTYEIGVGQQFKVDLLLNTEGEMINAVSAEVSYPQEQLELKEINQGNSIINFWVDNPRITTKGNTNSNKIIFSGIIPGGFNGKDGLIFSMVFLAKQAGNSKIYIEKAKSLLNDGMGTETKTAVQDLFVAIRSDIRGDSWIIPQDTEPPEEFTPEIARDPNIFEGKWFLVFATQDKGSGIDYYEVCEGKRKCVIAESPYLLKNQNLDEEIIVKAIDKNGNARIVTLPAQKPAIWYKNYLILAIIILVMAIAYLIWKFHYGVWKKRKK